MKFDLLYTLENRSNIIYICYYLEDIFYKTGGRASTAASVTTTIRKSTTIAASNVIDSHNDSGSNNNNWPLMNRAHLAQAIICVSVALQEKNGSSTTTEPTVSFCLYLVHFQKNSCFYA